MQLCPVFTTLLASKSCITSGFQHAFELSVPSTLKRLTIFEDLEEDFHTMLRGLGPGRTFSHYTPRKSDPAAGKSLARSSYRLEHLAASFTVKADNFLQDFWPSAAGPGDVEEECRWDNLETLALTSPLLSSPSAASPLVLGDLFEAASLAARRMPRLRTLELWHGLTDEHGCFFRFHHDAQARRAELVLGSTWGLVLRQRVIRSWQETVRLRAGECTQFDVRHDAMERDNTRFPASVLRHLMLKDRIVHEVVCCVQLLA